MLGYTFKIAPYEAIDGLLKGMLGMKVGGKRRLTIPSKMAWGKVGVSGLIPPNAALVYEIELQKVMK
jgi:FKBP-type peptidyl-prolyl cis-trans isomerase